MSEKSSTFAAESCKHKIMANTLNVQGTEISVIANNAEDYICLTDMAGAKRDEVRAADVIKNWLRNRYTIEFLGTWEQIHNPNFKVVEFDHFRMQAGLPNFVLSVSEWLEKTNAIGRLSMPTKPMCLTWHCSE